MKEKEFGQFVIYSRKSKFTGKGERIGNQVELCKEYIRANYGDQTSENVVIYEDEGFSGGNLNRPDFKKMMKAAREKKFKAIVVYRLDRISRNISDFSALIEELSQLDIAFISIREQFDTGNPMGRAMMYIACLKCELVHLRHYETRSQAEAEIFAYIEALYSTLRPHSALGWRSPFHSVFHSIFLLFFGKGLGCDVRIPPMCRTDREISGIPFTRHKREKVESLAA